MSLRFSNDGPEFPNVFVDALLAGDMVFLCGAGVSAPQMPGFRSLVERTYEILGVEMTVSEKNAFEKGLFPVVIAGKIDVLPAEWRQMGQITRCGMLPLIA